VKHLWKTAVSWRLVVALAMSATAIGGGAMLGFGAIDTVVVLSGMMVMAEAVHRMLSRWSATDIRGHPADLDQESSGPRRYSSGREA
jgi:hypothetical protein